MVVGWIVAVGMLIAGGAMVRVGMRGRRVDDHPICRRCGFDLVGLPAGSLVCSECGADVKGKEAIRVGHRERRWGWIATGMILAVPSVLGMGVMGWVGTRGVDVNRYKPVWWLVREAKASNVEVRDGALRELIARVGERKLSAGQVEQIAEEWLWRQADTNRGWVAGWGTFLEAAQDAGLLGKEQWRRYVRQSVAVELRVRPRVRRGDVVPVQIAAVRNPSIGSSRRFSLRVEGMGIELGGMEIPHHGYGAVEGGLYVGGMEWSVEVPAEIWEKLQEGEQSAKARVRLVIKDGRSGPVVVDEKMEVTAKWTVVGKDVQTVELIKDEGQKAAVQTSLKVERVHVERGSLDIDVESRTPGVNLGMNVFLRVGQKEWKVGSVCFRGPGTAKIWVNAAVPEGFAGERADVVLRGSAEAAMKSFDMFEIWDGEVVIKDVPVEWGKK